MGFSQTENIKIKKNFTDYQISFEPKILLFSFILN